MRLALHMYFLCHVKRMQDCLLLPTRFHNTTMVSHKYPIHVDCIPLYSHEYLRGNNQMSFDLYKNSIACHLSPTLYTLMLQSFDEVAKLAAHPFA